MTNRRVRDATASQGLISKERGEENEQRSEEGYLMNVPHNVVQAKQEQFLATISLSLFCSPSDILEKD